jgi:hypothetical protein
VEVSAVIGRRLRKWMGWGLALAMSGVSGQAKVAPNNPVVVTISVHNDVAVPWGTIREAEDEASRVFREAGIEVEWVNCQAVSEKALGLEKPRSCREAIFPGHLQLRIVKQSVRLRPDIMGISFLAEDGSGCQADIFYEGIAGLEQQSNASLATILGHVASHEIGHLLLGTNSHGQHGIMRAVWGLDELVRASRGTLFFSKKESERMRARLERVEARRTEASKASGGSLGD